MLKLMTMITEAGYDDDLGHAVAMAAGYFNRNAPLKPKKTYCLQEIKELFAFLFEVKAREKEKEMQHAHTSADRK